ncbi:MAG TPA: gamma-glutamyltransferase, partial [Vicinamibacterales bacterium]|nr:gamma-glutamyltransferase [Vicinamibacterales bacterium]
MRFTRQLILLLATATLVGPTLVASRTSQSGEPNGVREAAWSPDGRRLAVSWFDAIWTISPDGRGRRRLVQTPGRWESERDPAWSPDGRVVAFAASTGGAFDLWTVPAGGGAPRQLTSLAGDERWPAWTPDGRLVFSHRAADGRWALHALAADAEPGAEPTRLTPDESDEWQGRVSPDGTRLVFVSSVDRADGDEQDLFVRDVTGGPVTRLTRGGGLEAHPTWAPDGTRVAYTVVRGGDVTVWVTSVERADDEPQGGGRGGRGGRGAGAAAEPAVLASRRGGVPAWSPDGEWLAIATFPPPPAGYNGNPNRSDFDPPVAFESAEAYALWRVRAPRPVDAGAAAVALSEPGHAAWVRVFDQVWQTLRSLYYREGAAGGLWDELGERYRPEMERVTDSHEAEAVIDRLVAEQPLIKPTRESTRAVVSSGHPLASAAGAHILERGGNVVDAGIATAFALGVVEPDASGLGGDGQAILYLNGMSEPVVVEYKDMTPSHATRDNPKLFDAEGRRIAGDGPTVANIPGVVAGLDLLYRKYGSGQVEWADLVAPAIDLAEHGYVLDEALPTTIAEGRASFEKYTEAARIFLPGGRVPRAGDRFVNRDYASTLRTLAREGGDSFYRGTVARQIAADMEENGGLITLEDLAQYRAIERRPLMGEYRGHRIYVPGPPVSTGLQLVETLQILDHYLPAPGARYTTDPDYLHHVIDAWRVRDGGARIADPERWQVDLGNHLERSHALERFGLIDPNRAYIAAGGGRGRGRGGLPPVPPEEAVEDRRIQTGTTAFVVADAEGNMIAFTQTLSTWGGNFYVSKGLGFLYNDHFRGGRGGTGFGAMLPLMR